MINANWLNTFVTLVDTGHFTKTAEKLFMTQPGVSQHINKLEKACRHPLIQRDKKRFELTEQGRLVYQYAKALNESEQKLLENLAFDNPYAGKCTIACSGALALLLYPELLERQVKHQELRVNLKAAPNHQILAEIQTGQIDVGIVTHLPDPSLFDIEAIGVEQLCLVLPKSEKPGESLDADALMKLGLINHPDAKHYLSIYFGQNQDTNFKGLNITDIPETGYVNQISQILEPVARGLGFTILPKSAVDSFISVNKLEIYQSQKPVLEKLYKVTKRNRQLPARFDVISEVLANLLS